MDWLNRLAPRERMLVLAAGLVLLVGLLYVFMIEPLAARLQRAQSRLDAERRLVDEMSASAREAAQLRAAMTLSLTQGQSVDSVLAQSLRDGGVPAPSAVVKQVDADRYSLTLSKAPLDGVLARIAQTHRLLGLDIERARLRRNETSGHADGELLLHRAEPAR